MSEEERKVAPYASEVISFRIEKDVAERYRQLDSKIKLVVIEITRQFLAQLVMQLDKLTIPVNVNIELKVTPVERVKDNSNDVLYERKLKEYEKRISMLSKELARLEAVEKKYCGIKELVRLYYDGKIGANELATHMREQFRPLFESEKKATSVLFGKGEDSE